MTMRRSVYLVCFIMVFCFTAAVSAQPLNFTQLLEKVEHKLTTIDEFQSMASIKVVEGERINLSVFSIKASKSLMTTRIEMLEPDVISGQVIVVDQEKDVVKMYMPVLDQIVVQSLEEAYNGDMDLDFTDIGSFFNMQGLEGQIKEVIETDVGLQYIVSISGLDNQLDFFPEMTDETGGGQHLQQYIWINEEFMPFKMEFYQDDKYLGTFALDEFEINLGLTKEEMQNLPDVPEVVF